MTVAVLLPDSFMVFVPFLPPAEGASHPLLFHGELAGMAVVASECAAIGAEYILGVDEACTATAGPLVSGLGPENPEQLFQGCKSGFDLFHPVLEQGAHPFRPCQLQKLALPVS